MYKLIPVILIIAACGVNPKLQNKENYVNTTANPEWAKDAIWYQIFPERFQNGDPLNDPTIETLEGTWPYDVQTRWGIVPWTDDWYKLQPWEEANDRGFYYNGQLRRYGGDIQGIIDGLDYLEDLGINSIYLNPVFESPSSHKYGAVYYHHIDNNFGPDPAGDEKLWEQETHDDPTTWKWTAADRLFLKLIEEVHARDMHIIIDGVFNHVGIPFWALDDVKVNGPHSQFADWFMINEWDDPDTPEDEFDYQGWYGIKDLPELREDENGLIAPIEDYLHAAVKKWMDPNNDGDPSDGIDGWRLDVAEMVNMNFWRKLRTWTTAINPDVYLTGEVWWHDYMKGEMFNAAPWLQGDAFHSVMNYRMGDALYKFFLFDELQISATDFQALLDGFIADYGFENMLQIQNVIGSHDNERLASACVNPDRQIDHANNLNHNPEYDVRKPNAEERKKQKAAVALQFTFLGSPYIYYGDEVGMWGADDPDERKPMIWQHLKYEDETHHPFGDARPRDKVEVDQQLLIFYKKLTSIRNKYPALRRGAYEVLKADDERQLFVFQRTLDTENIIAVFNGSNQAQSFKIDEVLDDDDKHKSEYSIILSSSAMNTPSQIESKGFIVYAKN